MPGFSGGGGLAVGPTEPTTVPAPFSPATIQTLFAPAIPFPVSSISTVPRTLGMLFTVSTQCILAGIWIYSGTGCTIVPGTCGIFKVSGQTIVCQNSSPTWSEAAASGWIRCDMSSFGVTLLPGVQYQVVVGEATAGTYSLDTSGYFGSGGLGAKGVTVGNLTAPGGASNPGWFSSASSFSYPGSTGANECFFTDVEVYTPAGAWCTAQPLASTTFGNLTLANNVWNTSVAGPQVIWANSPSDWGFQTIQGGAFSTEVKCYPSIYQLLGNPVSSYVDIHASYSIERSYSGAFVGDVGWDCWLNNYAIEIFFLVDNVGQAPEGTVVGTYESGGDSWTVYEVNSTHLNLWRTHYADSGRVNLLEGFQWLYTNGYFAGSTILNQVGFGIEVCSTGNQPMSFKVDNYSQVCM